MPSPLPASWVEKLFERFTIRYGSAWLRMWEGIDMAAVKADWSNELAGLHERPEALRYALQYLPACWPPTVQQFRELCNAAPEPNVPVLPAPEVDRGRVAAVLEKLRAVGVNSDPIGWATKLRLREEAGERLSPTHRQAWRDAMRCTQISAGLIGDFTPPPQDALPPAMRGAA